MLCNSDVTASPQAETSEQNVSKNIFHLFDVIFILKDEASITHVAFLEKKL